MWGRGNSIDAHGVEYQCSNTKSASKNDKQAIRCSKDTLASTNGRRPLSQTSRPRPPRPVGIRIMVALSLMDQTNPSTSPQSTRTTSHWKSARRSQTLQPSMAEIRRMVPYIWYRVLLFIISYRRNQRYNAFHDVRFHSGLIVRSNMAGENIIIPNTAQAAFELMDKRSMNYSDRPRMILWLQRF